MSLLLLFSGTPADTIVPNETLHGNTTDAATVTTTSELGPNECLHANTTDASGVASTFIYPNEALHGHTADTAMVLQVINPADCRHTNLTDAAGATSTNTLNPRECTHANTTDATAVLGNLIPGDVLSVILVQSTVTARLIQPTIDVAMIVAYELLEIV